MSRAKKQDPEKAAKEKPDKGPTLCGWCKKPLRGRRFPLMCGDVHPDCAGDVRAKCNEAFERAIAEGRFGDSSPVTVETNYVRQARLMAGFAKPKE